MSSVSKLKIIDVICEDESIISNYVANFYEQLYSRQTLDIKSNGWVLSKYKHNITNKKSLIIKYLKL